MQTNQNMKTSEYKKLLNDYHRLSDRHVLVLETNLSYQDRCKVFHLTFKSTTCHHWADI